MEVTFVAVAFGHWGHGANEANAIKQLRKAGGRAKDFTVVYRVEYEAGKQKPYVAEDGSLCFFGSRKKIAVIRNGKRKELADA